MGHQHQTGCQLAEQSSEQLHPDTVWGHNWSLYQGKNIQQLLPDKWWSLLPLFSLCLFKDKCGDSVCF